MTGATTRHRNWIFDGRLNCLTPKTFDKKNEGLSIVYIREKEFFLGQALEKLLRFLEIDYLPQSRKDEILEQMEFLTNFEDHSWKLFISFFHHHYNHPARVMQI